MRLEKYEKIFSLAEFCSQITVRAISDRSGFDCGKLAAFTVKLEEPSSVKTIPAVIQENKNAKKDKAK